ncbi:MAG TPA: type II toxin-antitoxin system VapC family toxin [Verrucomicrobiae bacterium]
MTRRLLSEAAAGAAFLVPALWHLEVANALLVAVRRRLMTDAHRQAGLGLLRKLRLAVDEETGQRAFSTISELAVRHALSVYDAAYLELASRRSLPLGSRDESLRAAARKCGVKLLFE